jgi:hypothetical protein
MTNRLHRCRIPRGDFYLMVQGHHEAFALTHAKSVAGAIRRLHELGCEHVIVVNGTESLISSDEHSSHIHPLPQMSHLHFGGVGRNHPSSHQGYESRGPTCC